MQKIGNIPNTRADNNGEFTDGNVAGGVPPTILPAEWFNTIQRELISVLSAAGITPDSNKFDQVSKAVSKLITDGGFLKTANNLSEIKTAGPTAVAQTLLNLGLGELSIAGVSGGSLTTSGYITIPMIISRERRVLYIQWGGFTGTTDSSGSNGIYENSNITVTWPVAFPNAVFQVITGGSSDVGGVGQQEIAWSLDKTKTNGDFGFQCRTPNASMTGSYLVIGY